MCDHKQLETKFCPECGLSQEAIKKELEENKSKDLIAKLNELYVKFKKENTELYSEIELLVHTCEIVNDRMKNLYNINIYGLSNINNENALLSLISLFFTELKDDTLVFTKSIIYTDGVFKYLDDHLLDLFNKYKDEYPNVKYNDLLGYCFFSYQTSSKYVYYYQVNGNETIFINRMKLLNDMHIARKCNESLLDRCNKKLEATDDPEIKRYLEVIQYAIKSENLGIIAQLLKK
jgi:hypothetical protein